MGKENSSFLTASFLFIYIFATVDDCFLLEFYSNSPCADCHNTQNHKLLAAPVSRTILIPSVLHVQ